jgi:hypothetical protein
VFPNPAHAGVSVIGCPLKGTGLGLIVTTTKPADALVDEGDVEESLLHIVPVSAAMLASSTTIGRNCLAMEIVSSVVEPHDATRRAMRDGVQ